MSGARWYAKTDADTVVASANTFNECLEAARKLFPTPTPGTAAPYYLTTIPALVVMTEQQIFDAAAHLMLAHGGSAYDLTVAVESDGKRRRYRVPAHVARLIEDLDRIHKETNPVGWRDALNKLAGYYNLKGLDA